MKKVLVVVKTLAVGGVASVIFSYYSVLYSSELIHIDFAAGNPIEERYKKIIKNGNSQLYILPERDKNLIRYIIHLIKILRAGKYEAIHVHGNSSLIFPELIAAIIANVKIRIAHCHNTSCEHNFIAKMANPLFHLLYTDRVACGEMAGEWMFQNRNFIVLKNGIDLENAIFSKEKRAQVRQNLGVENKLVIGHVGAFNYQKNHELLIEIFREIVNKNKSAMLLLVGKGENLNKIRELVEEYGLTDNVIFYGESENVLSLMQAMDVFILPSRFEGLPCVLIEAQALGLPCIVSSTVSIEAKMSEKYKVMLINDNAAKWAEKAIETAIPDDLRYEICEKNHKRLKENGYDINASAKELEKIYLKKIE